MYLPVNTSNNVINEYDVRSLYPASMAEGFDMPVISKKKNYISYFEGDISLFQSEEFRFSNINVSKAFGFFNVRVKTTKELEHPILQLKHKTKNGFRT
jgi:hypothetical protein